MLPVVAGRAATTRQILFYSILLLPISLLPWALGFAGTLYGAVALVSGAILVMLALQLHRSRETNRQAAQRMFVFSISYLFLLFAALLTNNDPMVIHVLIAWCSACQRVRPSRQPATPRPNCMPFHHSHGRRGLICATLH